MQGIDEVERRIRSYWIVDGLADVLVGASLLGFALCQTMADAYPSHPINWWGLTGSLYVIATIFGGKRLVQRMKWKITYPRTGYVGFPILRDWDMKTVAVLVLVLGSVTILALSHLEDEASVAALAAILAVLLLIQAHRLSARRYVGYAVVSLVGGTVSIYLLHHSSGILHLSISDGNGVFVLSGSAMLIGGLWALKRYLKAHPAKEEENAEF